MARDMSNKGRCEKLKTNQGKSRSVASNLSYSLYVFLQKIYFSTAIFYLAIDRLDVQVQLLASFRCTEFQRRDTEAQNAFWIFS